MAQEINVRNFIDVKYGNVRYNPPQSQWSADYVAAQGKGPSPGALTATYDGTDVSVAQFTDPGWVHIINQEPAGGVTVSFGIYDPQVRRYYPFGRLDPGQDTGLIQLDDLFGGEFYPATGTGSSLVTNSLRVKAKDHAGANVVVNVFER
jgi:hypothetical protein